MSTLSQNLREYVAGCFTGIWVESREPQEAIVEIAQLCRDESWQFATWNIDQGLRVGGDTGSTGEMTDPLAAVKASQAMGADTTSIIVLENFHRFLSSVEIIQAMASQIHAGKTNPFDSGNPIATSRLAARTRKAVCRGRAPDADS